MAEQEEGVLFNEGNLTCIAQNWSSIPDDVVQRYAATTKRLDMSFNVLRELSGLENFTLLEELVVDNNELGDSVRFPPLNHLHTVMLNKNAIMNIDGLLEDMGKQLPALRFLSLLGNVACPNELSSSEKDEDDYRRYRLYVLYKLPNLRFLDSRPASQKEKAEAARSGQFMKVVRMDETTTDTGRPRARSSEVSGEDYTPLPQTLASAGDHKGTFGVCRYVYYGRHSEGNRFIRNRDL
ncbi:leucine-rich melanocyte differentiation-associated protein-like [Sycon ciliatum]|uniref:leucine-rich melanocyte differentiation-associated protein-like n=1 Tax=Sycon ciliatum TaxID=27933 RepID=UPI0020ADB165|eukprot:scpid69883/ scgid31795/ Leucine-rich repeat-containing protein C10orf11 homolog